MKTARYIALSMLSILALSGCETMDNFMKNVTNWDLTPASSGSSNSHYLLGGDCPKVEIVNELSSLSDYTTYRSPVMGNLISRINMTEAQRGCEYTDKSVTVDLKVTFEGLLGPRARMKPNDQPFFSYPFFVAVTAPDGDILAKEVFAASVTYDKSSDTKTYYENLRQIIPVGKKSRGKNYKILVGFQLSQEQLQFNRESLRSGTPEPVDEIPDPSMIKIERNAPVTP